MKQKYFYFFFCLIFILITTNLLGCNSIQQMIAGTPTPTPTLTHTPTLTPTLTPTVTPSPTQTPTPTITPNLTATEQYNQFLAIVQTIYDAGQISTLDGTYKKLDDFSDEYATNFGYRWSKTGIGAKDFIIRANFDWSIAHQKNYSGCGYVFREKSDEFYYMMALDALDGVLLSYTKEGSDALWGTSVYNYSISGSRKTKLPDMGPNPYQVTFTLVVNDLKAYTYINDIYYSEFELQKNWLTETGPLSFLILTGSDIDFGTKCDITNAEAWIINK